MTKRFGMGNKKVIKARDLDGDGKKSSYEMARAKGMAKGMGARFEAKKGGSAYHTTKDGRRVKKGLYYYMNIRNHCLLYTSPSPRDGLLSRMPSSA